MSGIWDKFDDVYDSKAIAKDIAEGKVSNDYEKVPYDTYIVKVEKLEAGVTKENKPKIVCWFKIVEGRHKGKLIFMNQVISERFLIHKANEFLKSLDSGIDVTFESFSQYADMLMDIHEKITAEKLEYQLKFFEEKKFDSFEIMDVFTAE